MLEFIGNPFPDQWLWSRYERRCIESIRRQIDHIYPKNKNLLINLTWFGPQFNNGLWDKYLQLKKYHVDNLFLLSTVDPAMISPPQIEKIVIELGNPTLFKIGNFDTEYHFNFFAPVLSKHYVDLRYEDLILKDLKYLYINYNRKPREHRVAFVRKLIQHNLRDLGIVTLGKPNLIYDKDPDNDLYFSIGEDSGAYSKDNHWHSGPDEFGIPHDVLTFHRIDYWQQHFLNVIGATEFNHWDDIFVSETQFKPILGLRPFVINGNPRTYQWLRNQGFKTFNHYWPHINLEDGAVHDTIIELIKYLNSIGPTNILSMYNDMLPDLTYNKNRFWEFAQEQDYLIDCILNQ